jgi:Lrp/AsnC family leucine-responsive transcriptional regulator
MLNLLDEIDIRILQILQENARITHKEIADKLYKSPTAILRRIKRLEDEGYIKFYAAILDHNKIDRSLLAFTHISLKDHSKESLSSFEKEVILQPEVLECVHVSGTCDFILRVAVRDLPTYHDWLMNKLFTCMAVGSVESNFVMKEAKHTSIFQLPIPPRNFPSAGEKKSAE